MTKESCLENVLLSYKKYYDVSRNPCGNFCATAEFHSHEEQYFLTRSARIAEVDSNEYVYFSVEEKLSLQKLKELSNAAWADGLSKVKPFYGHKNSDISLIAIAGSVEKDAAKEARKIKFHKSYKFSFFGWSNFSLIVYDVSAGKTWFNWHGRNLRSIFSKMPL